MNNKKWRKSALALSACLFIIWWALGTGATLAWFSDVDTVRNEFRIGLLKLDVSYKNNIVTEYTPLKGATEVFYDEALYEPGYTQVAYLKIDSPGDVSFNYKIAVTVEEDDNNLPMNVLGKEFRLREHLRYGVVFAESEAQLRELVKDRATTREVATQRLDTWSGNSPYTFIAGGEPHYAALIVHMPETVGNEANYRGFVEPKVELGITVFAQQANVTME